MSSTNQSARRLSSSGRPSPVANSQGHIGRGLAIVLLSAALTCFAAQSSAQTQAQSNSRATITPNYKDADLSQIIEAVSAVTGKTFIIDPRVKAQVTMLSSTPMSPNAFYEAFLSILQVHGYVAVPAGNVIKIIPDANARQVPGNDLPGSVSSTSDELVTQVIAVRNVSATQLVPILRPLIPQYGQLAAYPASNMLIITDRANNVNRMMKIIERIDRASDDEIEVVQMQNATAAEIVKVVNSLNSGAAATAQNAEGGQPLKVVSDDRTNSILLSGDKSARLRVKTLIAYLDTPLQSGGNTQVRYLQYADAEDLAKKLKEQIQGITQATTASNAPGGAAPAGSLSSSANNASIWADKDTNALIISAPPKVMQQIAAIVDKLDIRRAQVHVEAIVVEVSASKAAQLGINWAVYGNGSSNIPAALFNAGTNSITSIASAVESGSLSSLPTGATVGIGRIVDSGTDFAAIIQALQQDGHTNIISTPSINTLDNQEAKIEVAQEVPFLTGQYASTGTSTTSTSNSVNPFQTIQRQDVGTKLTITPKISEGGDSVQLKIEQETSSLGSKGDAVDLITNKRTISTTVRVEDGGIIVLGGLIEDKLTEGNTRVPVLGSIPIIGNLFKTRNSDKEKTNLMVFIRPTILRDGVQASIETNAKYNMMRGEQLKQNKGKVSLQPTERQPILPELPKNPVDKNKNVPNVPVDNDTGLTTSPLPPPAQ